MGETVTAARKGDSQDESLKLMCLLEELETSRELIKSGFGHLQEIDIGNTFYHLPHQLLASGFERLMKCYISLVYNGQNGSYPDKSYIRDLGHNIEDLLQQICKKFYGGTTRSLLRQELDFIANDRVLQECIRILSLFGKKGRYYNLDIVIGAAQTPIDPTGQWKELELQIEDATPFLHNPENLYRDYYPRVHSNLIARMERLARAIAMQFTLGDHADKSGRLRQASPIYTQFRNLRDKQLGTIDYRRSVRILEQSEETWIKRSDQEIASGKWPTQIVTKDELIGHWPFRTDHVVVERRDDIFYIVNIDGYTFALNGAARSRFKVPYPHDAGLAVLGRSIGPFIDIASTLR